MSNCAQTEGGRAHNQNCLRSQTDLEGSIGEIIINYYFFFDSKRHPKRNLENGQSLGAGIAVLSAKARLCLASAEEHMLLSPKRQAFSRYP